MGGFAAAISQALFEVSPLLPGVYWSFAGSVTLAAVVLALWLNARGWVQLTHRREEPYFGESLVIFRAHPK